MTRAIEAEYKHTEVGVIPKDWEVVTIADVLSEISMGPFGSDIKVSNFVRKGVPVLSGFNVGSARLKDSFTNYVSPEKAKSLKKAVANRGDIVVTHRGTIGQISYIPDDSMFEKYVISQSQFRAKFISKVLPSWVVTYFLSPRGSNSLLEGKGHTGVPAIAQATTTFRKIVIPLPELNEQAAIIGALSDMDALISGLDQLIAKKRDIKQATMQQLLTGQTRLPGFSGEWEVKRLGDVLDRIVGGGTPSRSNPDYWGGEIPWVTVKDFATFHPCHAQETITADGLKSSSSNLIPAGVLITSTRMALGKAVMYAVDVSINQDLKALFTKPAVSVNYLYFWFEYHSGEIDELGSGSTVKGLSLGDLRSIAFLLPSREEQEAIATTLADMDAELAVIEARRDKAKQLKQGMMQELLTGRIRLV